MKKGMMLSIQNSRGKGFTIIAAIDREVGVRHYQIL
jgi:hypothetical protein